MKKTKDFNPNISPVGWYVASLVERFEFYDEDIASANHRCEAWENLVLIKAETPDEAYRKVVALGKLHNRSEMWTPAGRKGAWRFEGISSLLPVYEELEDGAEIRWTKHQNKAVKTIKAKVKRKAQLEAFRKNLP